MSDTKKISQYGFNFQVKFITCLITDKLFLEQIYDILDEKYMGCLLYTSDAADE